ncbi:MAG: ATP-binding protein [Spirochaetaceae bacterium]|nr:MAG: ATP-binding protein [Spirochaetaceae bacterium]
MWIDRDLATHLVQSASQRPAVLVTGARQTGKSSLFRRSFPDHRYVTLDRPLEAQQAQENPDAFLQRHGTPIIIDEVQYAPGLFRALKVRIDEDRDQHGCYLLTGSQTFPLMHGVRESLAGRVRLLHLHTLSAVELRKSQRYDPEHIDAIVWRGGYPELWANSGLDTDEFYEDYVGTYLERDLRQLVAVREVNQFRVFLGLIANRIGNILNYSDVSRSVGVTANTIKDWIAALEASGLVFLLPPWFESASKRLVKTPKIYFADTGLAVHLQGLSPDASIMRAPAWGALWENFVISELVKTARLVPGRSLFFYRDTSGHEVDAVIRGTTPDGTGTILLEAKSSEASSTRIGALRAVAAEWTGAAPALMVAAPVRESEPLIMADHTVCDPRRALLPGIREPL